MKNAIVELNENDQIILTRNGVSVAVVKIENGNWIFSTREAE